jgi:hypothetical protein
MSADATPLPGGPPQSGRLDNGLIAQTYVPLADVAEDVGRHLITVLGRARIAAYLDTPPGAHAQLDVHPPSAEPSVAQTELRRIFVDAEERADARTVVAAALRALGAADSIVTDPLAGVDTDAAFAELVSDWHVDTVRAIREAERDLSREDEDWRARLLPPPAPEPVWLDEGHYIPPPPPPLPRFATPTIVAMSVLAISILLLGLGGDFGLASDLTLLMGVGGVLLAATMLVLRLRETHDDDDDGTAI